MYRGMGSIGAMQQGSRDRYFQVEVETGGGRRKLVAEGIEGRVPYKGNLSAVVFQLVGGVRAGMGYCGVRHDRGAADEDRFVRVTDAGRARKPSARRHDHQGSAELQGAVE